MAEKLEYIEKVMKKYKLLKEEMLNMDNPILYKALVIIDNAEGVSHDDFFEIIEYFLYLDKVSDIYKEEER
jgi:hypothetical protein